VKRRGTGKLVGVHWGRECQSDTLSIGFSIWHAREKNGECAVNPNQKVFQAFANAVESRLGKDDEDSMYVPAEAKVVSFDRNEIEGNEIRTQVTRRCRWTRREDWEMKSVPLQLSFLDDHACEAFLS
jgi:hypothetical protein